METTTSDLNHEPYVDPSAQESLSVALPISRRFDAPDHTPSKLTFFDLPCEIRNQIYKTSLGNVWVDVSDKRFVYCTNNHSDSLRPDYMGFCQKTDYEVSLQKCQGGADNLVGSLLFTCRQIMEEFRDILHQSSFFSFGDIRDFNNDFVLSKLSPLQPCSRYSWIGISQDFDRIRKVYVDAVPAAISLEQHRTSPTRTFFRILCTAMPSLEAVQIDFKVAYTYRTVLPPRWLLEGIGNLRTSVSIFLSHDGSHTNHPEIKGTQALNHVLWQTRDNKSSEKYIERLCKDVCARSCKDLQLSIGYKIMAHLTAPNLVHEALLLSEEIRNIANG